MSDFPTAQDFCASIPLYAFHPVTEENFEQFLDFCQRTKSIDMHCMKCNTPSTFKLNSNEYAKHKPDLDNWAEYYDYLSMRWKCSRNDNHEIIHLFMFDNERGVQKIGQYPSAHDNTMPELKKYKKILGPEKNRELVKAVGLHAHGVGAGSLIYLRRILEWLIDEAYIEAQKSTNWVDIYQDNFVGLRVADKIKCLKHYLPDFLVENTKIYSILSKGVHSTPESECLGFFPVLKVAIELILNQKIRAIEQKNNEFEINRLLQSLLDN